MPNGYATGHRRAANKDHLMALSARKHRALMASLMAQDIPPAFDCRDKGWVGPVKNQANCGSCWDFSGTCVVESAYYVAGVHPNDGSMAMSEEYTLSCGQNGGCNGDDNTTVLEWAKKTGLVLSKDYGPYTANAGRCAFKQSMTLYKLDDWGFCDPNASQSYESVTDTAYIKAMMLKYGPIGCAIAADDAFSNASPNGVFDRTTSTGIDHDVVLVGWDDSKGSKGAWILRNSWDKSWCNGGYCWIGYGVNKVGTEAVWGHINASAPPVDYYV